MKKHYIYVYGTLRTKDPALLVKVPGFLYDVSWFPGALIKAPDCGSEFVAERREITDDQLSGFDDYEGYRPDSPATSLYIRVPYLDGWIYQYNRDVTRLKRIESGDWFEYQSKVIQDRNLEEYLEEGVVG